ncbi:MAG: 4Fe-4S dicluster domain-containing protein [Endomicrobium sp.]|jgi:carbon-monoxide dehydrogenase iron sulfur subunit|nr:4Fe-4S dicluster domain-containing protein [Endomicrobium sp.]
MKKIYSFEDKCLGCKLCEVYCKTARSKSKNIIKANKEENIDSAIIVEKTNKDTHFALQCRHCTDAKCIKACISGAIFKDEIGIVRYDKEKCVSCLSCVLVCPFGAVRKSDFNSTVTKCDLCFSTGKPLCVSNCPNDAIKFLDEKEIDDRMEIVK